MNKVFALVLVLLLCTPIAYSQTRTIVGSTVDGPNDSFPLSATLLCDGGGAILDCPQFFSPDWSDTTGLKFYGLSNRTNPPRCVQSTDGGTVWGLCSSNPFVAAVDDLGAHFSVASDGSLIVAANQGANNCIIRRSTDHGVSWTTVYTDTTATVNCGLSYGGASPNNVRCASEDSYCVAFGHFTGSFDLVAYYSIDYGATWTKGTIFNIVSSDEQLGIAVASDGFSGSLTRYGINYNTVGRKFAYMSGTDWLATGLIPVPIGEVGGNSSRCVSGAAIFNGQSVFCGPGGTLTTTYHLFTHAGGTVLSTTDVVPQNGLTNAQAPDFMMVGYDSTTAYMVGKNGANTRVVVWITRDTFSSVLQIASLTPTTAVISGCCRGDIHVRNGKVYFSSGASGSNAFLGAIQ
jgi:hypothetical protein